MLQKQSADIVRDHIGTKKAKSEKGYTAACSRSGNHLTATQIVALIAGIVPADAEPARVVPVDARDTANRVARTVAECNVHDVEMLTRFQVVLQLVKQTLQRVSLHSDVTECVRGLVLPLLVRFDYISDPDGVAAVTRITIVGRDCFVEVLIRVLPCAKLLGALIENLLDRDALGDNDQPVEAFAALWDLETCEAELETEVNAVEALPLNQLLVGGPLHRVLPERGSDVCDEVALVRCDVLRVGERQRRQRLNKRRDDVSPLTIGHGTDCLMSWHEIFLLYE